MMPNRKEPLHTTEMGAKTKVGGHELRLGFPYNIVLLNEREEE